MRRLAFFPLGVLIAAAIATVGPAAAVAAPANDNFANATVVSALPFTDSVDLNGATTEPGEPQYCSSTPQTVWYVYTPTATTTVAVNLNGSATAVSAVLWQSFGSGFGGLSFQRCLFYGGSLEFSASAGSTYYIQAGSNNTGSALLQLNLQQVPPPANDNFANAGSIGTLPFSDNVDMSAATLEPGERTPAGAFTPITASVWYAFTPLVTESLSASANSCCITPILAVYTGSSLTGLTQVGTGVSGFGPDTFRAVAGTTYNFQLARSVVFGGSAFMSFSLQVTPPPVTSFFLSLIDPSVFDTVSFVNSSYDPGQIGFQSQLWTFGDGTSSSLVSPSHRYAADGSYTVKLAVTTLDGRTASASTVLMVKTNDVAIAKFSAPTSTGVGQTRAVTVGLSNKRYGETVQVQLFKSDPAAYNGYDLVGTLTQDVPVQSSNRTVTFDFTYTFTANDAAVGKVTFEAIASIIGARDAQPADNTAISTPPTKVN